MMHKIYHNIMAASPPFEVRMYLSEDVFANIASRND